MQSRIREASLISRFEEFVYAIGEIIAQIVLKALRQEPVIVPRYLSVKQAAVYVSRSEKAIRHWITSGVVKNCSPDARVQVDIKDLDILMTGR
jgi:ribosomal protein S25